MRLGAGFPDNSSDPTAATPVWHGYHLSGLLHKRLLESPMISRRILFILLVLAFVWLGAPFQASGNASFVFQTDMFGSNVVPPVQTGAWGFVRFYFDEDRTEADYTVDVKGLSGSLVAGADLRFGAPGVEGPVVRHLADGGFIVTSGRLRLSPSEHDDFIAGNYYVTLYTQEHPDGELRGQVYVPSGFLPGTTPNGTEPTFAGIPAPVLPAIVPSTQAEPPGEAALQAAPDAAVASDAEPPSPRFVIRPPNTGDGGLLDATKQPVRAVMVGVAAVIIGAGLMFASGFSRNE